MSFLHTSELTDQPDVRRSFFAYPTRRGITLMALSVPLALFLSLLVPSLSGIGIFFMLLVVGLLFVDGLLAMPLRSVELNTQWPSLLYIDDVTDQVFTLNITAPRKSREVEVFIETNPNLKLTPHHFAVPPICGANVISADLKLSTHRRGMAKVQSVWARWEGPFGLIFKQNTWSDVRHIPVVPNIKAVTREAMRFFSRDAVHGEKIQLDRGEGSEFESLRDFVKGMDTRDIDWKHSARHRTLLAKEFRTERNHNVVFAFDRGRLMCEPLLGIPKIDRAINASLVLAYIALKTGDKVGLYNFAAKPSPFFRPVGGLGSFSHIQAEAARIDYSIVETNFTLGLSRLSQALKRRSLIVVMTDFVDTTTAELMLENISRLVKKHLVVFVTFKDKEIEDITQIDPDTSYNVTRAVIANTLLNEREKVLARLRRMGVHVLETEPDALSMRMLNMYLDLRQKEAI